MNQVKKILLIIVPVFFILINYWLVIKIKDAKEQQALKKTEVIKQQKELAAKTENENKNPQDEIANELIGIVTEVYETQDPQVLLLTVNADVVENGNGIREEDEGTELVMKNKDFTVAITKDMPVKNGTFDEIEEDDFVKITCKENVYFDIKQFNATSLEEL